MTRLELFACQAMGVILADIVRREQDLSDEQIDAVIRDAWRVAIEMECQRIRVEEAVKKMAEAILEATANDNVSA